MGGRTGWEEEGGMKNIFWSIFRSHIRKTRAYIPRLWLASMGGGEGVGKGSFNINSSSVPDSFMSWFDAVWFNFA